MVAVSVDRPDDDGAGPATADTGAHHGADDPHAPDGRAFHVTPDTPAHPAETRATGETPETSDTGNADDRARYHDDLKARVEAEYRAYAIDRGCDRVRETEETVVTPAMRRIESADPDRYLAGLEYRLKGRDRLAEKVTATLEEQPDIKPDDAFAMVKDAIRYTFEYTEDKYAQALYADCARIEASGFEPFDRRNTWEHEEYKGINSRWTEPDSGLIFEVQFHTQASFNAKQLTHAAYEKLRSPDTPKIEQEDAARFQREVTACVPIPTGATEIPDYRYG